MTSFWNPGIDGGSPWHHGLLCAAIRSEHLQPGYWGVSCHPASELAPI